MKVYYNQADGNFYKDSDLSVRIYRSIAIWGDGRKNPAVPKIPFTVTNSFDGNQGGNVMVGGTSEEAPHRVK